MKKMIVTAITLLLLMLPLAAQTNLPKPSFSPWQNSSNSLFNLNKLSMSHSLGFSAGTSSEGRGYYFSRYTNHLSYQFNPKLELDLDLNLVNFGTTGSSFSLNDDNKSKIIPEFRLRWKPSDSVQIQVQFQQGNPFLYQDAPWYERW